MAMSILERRNSHECFRCGAVSNLEQHHVFGGMRGNRDKSEHYGLKVTLCAYCHRDNKNGVHSNAEAMQELKRYAQEVFEKKYDHETFIREFGKNYK